MRIRPFLKQSCTCHGWSGFLTFGYKHLAQKLIIWVCILRSNRERLGYYWMCLYRLFLGQYRIIAVHFRLGWNWDSCFRAPFELFYRIFGHLATVLKRLKLSFTNTIVYLLKGRGICKKNHLHDRAGLGHQDGPGHTSVHVDVGNSPAHSYFNPIGHGQLRINRTSKTKFKEQ